MKLEELRAFLRQEFPQVSDEFRVEEAGEELALRLVVAERHLRPGGTVSGPAMFGLAAWESWVQERESSTRA